MSDAQEPAEIPLDTLLQFQHYIRFVSRDPTKNRNRFYLLSWQPTLDVSTALVCTWGMPTRGRSRLLCTADQPNGERLEP